MKILIQNYYDFPLAGAESYLSNLISGLKKAGHEAVGLFTGCERQTPCLERGGKHAYYLPDLSRKISETFSDFIQEVSPLIRPGKQLNLIPGLLSLLGKKVKERSRAFEREAGQLLEIIEKENIDLLYLNNFNSLFIFKFIRLDIPVIQMLHDYFWVCPKLFKLTGLYEKDVLCQKSMGLGCLSGGCLNSKVTFGESGFRNLIWRFIYLNFLAEIPDKLICASQFVKDVYVQNGLPEKKITAIPLFTFLERKGGSYPGSGPEIPAAAKRKILFVGRISYEKGLIYLLKALQDIPDFELDIIGSGNESARVRALADKSGLGGRVHLRGRLSREEIKPFMREARLVVVPSIWPEPFGMVGIEAMAFGKPVVAFDVGGVREWLKDGQNGYLIPPKDTKAMAEKINLLLENDELAQQMGRRGQEDVAATFNSQNYVRQIISIFQGVIDRGYN